MAGTCTTTSVDHARVSSCAWCALQAVAKSKYEEDVFPGNHTSIFGSYFDTRSMRWGYQCCHSLTFKSYCTGDAGRIANDEANSVLHVDEAGQRKMLEARSAGEKSKVLLSLRFLIGGRSALVWLLFGSREYTIE